MPGPQQPTAPATRLAPSPTGALHLGNARTFLINWAIARQAGQRIAMRIDDLAGPRIKPEAAQDALDILAWLGIDWDGQPLYESHDLTPYRSALENLHQRGLIYPCKCSRKDIERALSAPHEDDHERRYPGTCRPTSPHSAEPSSQYLTANATAWRLIVPDETIHFTDQLQGPQSVNVQQHVGDFIVATKDGLPSYQLAVVVDDVRQGVTHVVRGDDLIQSTARQMLLYRLLNLAPLPQYLHLPLVLGPDGRRLAKRHGDTRVAAYRDAGATPQRIVGLLAYWSGLTPARQEMSAREFAQRFELSLLPRSPVTFTPEDEAWLTA